MISKMLTWLHEWKYDYRMKTWLHGNFIALGNKPTVGNVWLNLKIECQKLMN